MWGKNEVEKLITKWKFYIYIYMCLTVYLHVFTHACSVALQMALLVSWSTLVQTEISQC